MPRMEKSLDGICAYIWAALMAFLIYVFALIRSVGFLPTKNLPGPLSDSAPETMPTGEFRHPVPALEFTTEADLFPSVLKRLGELEEKVNLLQEKPSEMPSEKEELLNAVVYRVDALEADLISTKKALHEALMRQEELLAYMDSQAEAKFRRKKCCW